MNHSTPTHDCAAYEALLPLLTTSLLTDDETRDLLAHAETCAYCRAQIDEYAALETAGRRYYGPDTALPISVATPLKLDDIIHANASNHTLDETATAVVPSTPQRPRAHRSVWLRILPEIAAVLTVALLATTLLVNRPGASNTSLGILPAGGNAVVFAHAVPWGRLTIDGQPVDISAHIADGQLPMLNPLYLPHTRNTITYTAAPFPTFTCTINAPRSPSDTCPLGSVTPNFNTDGTPVDAAGNPTRPWEGRAIDLRAIPNRLSADSLNALIAATQHVLDSYTSSGQVLPGDHYITASGKAATATHAFKVTLSFHVPVSQGERIGNEQCAPFCGGSIAVLEGSEPGAHWTLIPDVRWQYTLPNGQPVTVDTEQADGILPVDMAANWTGAWQVNVARTFQSDSFQAMIVSKLGQLTSAYGIGNRDDGRFATAPADGYLLAVMYTKTRDITSGQTTYILYRAGALIALDSSAETLFPSLPLASAHEMAIARQLGWK
jgi:hypothetical protein